MEVKRKRLRLQSWDYSSRGYYFVTICANSRQNIFGRSVGAALVSAQNSIELSELGKIIQSNWLNTPKIYEDVELDEYVIMPNHLHGILIINSRADTRAAPTISEIIRSFKSRSTVDFVSFSRRNNLYFDYKIWQRSFHDHIIRNERSLNAIREYIFDNPINWQHDIENLTNLQ